MKSIKKQLGATCLLAGTAIGSGIISLPIVLAKCGIAISCLLFALFTLLTYLSSLIRCDLNLNSCAQNSLQEASKLFGGMFWRLLSDICIKLLMYSLIAAYLSAFTSIAGKIFCFSDLHSGLLCIGIISLILFLPIHTLIHINRWIFCVMMVAFFAIIFLLTAKLSTFSVPSATTFQLPSLCVTIPVVFTSFGFQGSLHNMTSFVQNDVKMIRHSCFFGSLIPAVIYAVWTICILTIIFNTSPVFFQKMLTESVEVGELINVLAISGNLSWIPWIFQGVSFLAILTSLIGVALSLLEPFEHNCNLENNFLKRAISIAKTMAIPGIVAIAKPDAFVPVLNFSGILLSFIAMIIPSILHLKMRHRSRKIIIKSKILIYITLLCGLLIIALGF